MIWLKLLQTFLSISEYFAKIVHDRQLMDAGADGATVEFLGVMNERVKKALDARKSVKLDDDSLRDDSANRDGG